VKLPLNVVQDHFRKISVSSVRRMKYYKQVSDLCLRNSKRIGSGKISFVVLLSLLLCGSCGKVEVPARRDDAPRVGDVFRMIRTATDVRIEMVSTLDSVKALADTLYLREYGKLLGLPERRLQMGMNADDYSHLVEQILLLQLDSNRKLYAGYSEKKHERFFLHTRHSTHGVLVVEFGPVSLLQQDYWFIERK
jgi:hypothetical protein